MPKFSYNQAKKGLGEVQATHRWIIRIPVGAPVVGAIPENLVIRATSASVPSGGTAEPIQVKLHRHPIKYNGGVDLSGEWSCTFVEGTDGAVQAYFNRWINRRFEQGSGDTTGRSVNTDQLKADIFIDLLAPNDTVTMTYQLSGAMVRPLDSIDLGQDGEAMNLSYSFDYDNVYRRTGGYSSVG